MGEDRGAQIPGPETPSGFTERLLRLVAQWPYEGDISCTKTREDVDLRVRFGRYGGSKETWTSRAELDREGGVLRVHANRLLSGGEQ